MIKINYDETTHTYTNAETNETLISVTQLLEKHGLAPNYNFMKQNEILKEKLEQKANYGKLIHEEIENFVNNGEDGWTPELDSFKQLCEKENIKPIHCEKKVAYGSVAGTLDLLCDINGKRYVIDIKTTSTLHRNTVAWQTSLYAYLDAKSQIENKENSNSMYDFFMDIGAIHFDNGEAKLVLLEKIPLENIVKLLQCEEDGVFYHDTYSLLPVGDEELIIECEKQIVELQKQIKFMQTQTVFIRDQLMYAVERSGVNHHELGGGQLLITYVPKGEKKTLDIEKLKEEQPEIYEKYLKTTKVKEQLRIKLRD